MAFLGCSFPPSLATWCLLLAALYALLSGFSLGHKATASSPASDHGDDDEAELTGEPWAYLSVFAHLEQGLKRSPDGPAVICRFQPPGHLDFLLPPPDTNTNAQPSPPSPPSTPPTSSTPSSVPSSPPLQPAQNGLWQSPARPSPGQKQQSLAGSGDWQLCEAATAAPQTAAAACATLTYTQLHQAALRLAAALVAQGARPGTTLVMLVPNGLEYAVLLWACVLLRITYVCLDPDACLDIAGFTTLKHILRHVKPQAVVAPNPGRGRAVDVAVAELGLPQPIRVCLEASEASEGRAGWTSLAELASAASSTQAPFDAHAVVAAARHDAPQRVHSIMFTSGTSGGQPKGCALRVGGMAYVLQSQRWLVTPASGAAALMQPHNSRAIAPAQTLQTWKAGGAVVLTGQAFSVREAAAAMRTCGATFMVLTPTMVHEMADALADNAPSLAAAAPVQTIQVGGDAITRDVLARCTALFPAAQVCVNHGMTEGGGAFVWPFRADAGGASGSVPCFGEICPVGRVAPGSRIRIWRPGTGGGRVARRGQLGELHVSSPSLIEAYVGNVSPASFYRDAGTNRRWFVTGDMAMADASGLVYILGRRGDVIRRGGVVVMPAVIESSVEAFLGEQTVVVSVPHHVLGAEPFAVVRSYGAPLAGQAKTAAGIQQHVRAALGKDYALAGVASLAQLGMAEFPLNRTHKIVRADVREAALRYVRKV